jgi:quercetin dioxygenase-like cupin family protein
MLDRAVLNRFILESNVFIRWLGQRLRHLRQETANFQDWDVSTNIMDKLSTTVSFTRVVRECDCSVFEVLGASVEFFVGPHEGDEAPCILKGTIPSGVSIPMHSHDVVEIFFVLSGNIEVLVEVGGKLHWVEAGAGDLVEIPSNAKHAFRNRSKNPVLNLLFTTSKHGRYFQEIGRPVASAESVRPPAQDEIQHFLKTARRYGYWFATPEENASVGITLL